MEQMCSHHQNTPTQLKTIYREPRHESQIPEAERDKFLIERGSQKYYQDLPKLPNTQRVHELAKHGSQKTAREEEADAFFSEYDKERERQRKESFLRLLQKFGGQRAQSNCN
jgi:hypothetical protein